MDVSCYTKKSSLYRKILRAFLLWNVNGAALADTREQIVYLFWCRLEALRQRAFDTEVCSLNI